MKKLNTLLFNQGGKCFYCNAALEINEASIDHVIPRSKGGTDDIDNLVVCCKYANRAFADYSPKHKMAVIQQLCAFPSACKKIFPREEEIIKPNAIPPPKKLENKTQSTNAKPATKETKADISLAYQLLCQAIKSLEGEGGEANNGSVKKKMLALNPSFKESDYGFRQFKKFLLHAQQDKIVTLQAHKTAGHYIISCAKSQ